MRVGYGRGYYGEGQLVQRPKRRGSGWIKLALVVGAGAVIWLMWPRSPKPEQAPGSGPGDDPGPSPPSPPSPGGQMGQLGATQEPVVQQQTSQYVAQQVPQYAEPRGLVVQQAPQYTEPRVPRYAEPRDLMSPQAPQYAEPRVPRYAEPRDLMSPQAPQYAEPRGLVAQQALRYAEPRDFMSSQAPQYTESRAPRHAELRGLLPPQASQYAEPRDFAPPEARRFASQPRRTDVRGLSTRRADVQGSASQAHAEMLSPTSQQVYEDAVVASARQLQATGAKVVMAPHLAHLAHRLLP